MMTICGDDDLTPEELEIQKQRLAGEYIPVDNFEELKKKFEKWAKNHNKKRKITLNLHERNINLLKLEAEKEGIPYQTFIQSVLHKYVTHQLIEKKYLDKSILSM